MYPLSSKLQTWKCVDWNGRDFSTSKVLHAKSMINIAQCKLIKWRQTLLLHVSDLPRCFRKFFVKEKRPTRLGVALFYSLFLQSWLWKLYYKLMIINSIKRLATPTALTCGGSLRDVSTVRWWHWVYTTVRLWGYHQSNGRIADGRWVSVVVEHVRLHRLLDFRENWAHVLSEDNENGIDYIEFVRVNWVSCWTLTK